MSLQGNGTNGHGAQAHADAAESDPATDGAAGAAKRKRLHLAACALLLELAHADDEFSESERDHIEVVLRRHFDLDESEALELMELAEAERASAIDLYQFTTNHIGK